MESSTIQAKERDRQMIREAMATYTGPINVVTPPPGTNALAEWRSVNQIALPGSSINSKDQNELAAKVRRLRELSAQGARAAAAAKSLKMTMQGVINLAKAHGIKLA